MKGFFSAAVSALAILPAALGQASFSNVTNNGTGNFNGNGNTDTNTNINIGGIQNNGNGTIDGNTINNNINVSNNNVYVCQAINGCDVYPYGWVADNSSSVINISGFALVCNDCTIQTYMHSSAYISIQYEASVYYICSLTQGCGNYSYGFVLIGAEIDISIYGFVICASCTSSMSGTVVSSMQWYQCSSSSGCGSYAFNSYCLGSTCLAISGFVACSQPSVSISTQIGWYICNQAHCGNFTLGFVVSYFEFTFLSVHAHISGFVPCTTCVISSTQVYISNTFFICAAPTCGNYTHGQSCYSNECNLTIKGWIPCSTCGTSSTAALPTKTYTNYVQPTKSVPYVPTTGCAAQTVTVTETVCPTNYVVPTAPTTWVVPTSQVVPTQAYTTQAYPVVSTKAASSPVTTSAYPTPQVNSGAKVGASFTALMAVIAAAMF